MIFRVLGKIPPGKIPNPENYPPWKIAPRKTAPGKTAPHEIFCEFFLITKFYFYGNFGL